MTAPAVSTTCAALLIAAVCVGPPAHGAGGLDACADIESALERLDCYDALAKRERRDGSAPADPPEAEPSAPDTNTVRTRIENVRRTPAGRQVMTFSNGQTWVENEAGRRAIAPGQQVTIRRHRWHFEMELDGQPNVAVRRID